MKHTNEVFREPAVAEAACWKVGIKVHAKWREIGSGDGEKVVVVATIDCGVTKDKQCSHFIVCAICSCCTCTLDAEHAHHDHCQHGHVEHDQHCDGHCSSSCSSSSSSCGMRSPLLCDDPHHHGVPTPTSHHSLLGCENPAVVTINSGTTNSLPCTKILQARSVQQMDCFNRSFNCHLVFLLPSCKLYNLCCKQTLTTALQTSKFSREPTKVHKRKDYKHFSRSTFTRSKPARFQCAFSLSLSLFHQQLQQ